MRCSQVASTFFSLRDWVGPDGAAFVFGGLSVLAVVFVYAAVPETKNKVRFVFWSSF